tara:strand:- start:5591 stop:7159 length:1569 start_codon:yes stop_codon:yes gene_type:complete
MSYKVFIPTAGIGSRLGNLTNSINKSLVTLDNRPIITHLFDQFPDSCEFIIALGHKGNIVKQFLENLYPNKNIKFIDIVPYKGKNSGLGYTLISSKHHLQEPFVFISCDTLILNKIPLVNHNWVAFSNSSNIESYRTVKIKSNFVSSFKEKGEGLIGKDFPYIGLCGIYDYKKFWEGMYQAHQKRIEIGEISGLKNLISDGIKSYEMNWFDTGNLDSLTIAKEKFKSNFSPTILEKENEAIWFIKDKVVKFSTDEEFIKNRVLRARQIKDFIPKIIKSSSNMYIYQKEDGEVFSQKSNLPLFKKLLDTSNSFWERVNLDSSLNKEFKKSCLSFYKDKTIKRINKFFEEFNLNDNTQIINGEKVSSLNELVNSIDWNDISDGVAVRFHGDFHFENILWNKNNKKFIFLDWRQDFGGCINYGDIYYDLAKLMHGLIVSHKLIEEKHFKIDWDLNIINFELKRFYRDVEFEKYFLEWCTTNNYNIKKIKILTALIYLNIAPLHHVPYNYLLFALGKLMLHRELLN